MDVSIIIPVYKVEDFIARCLQSVMNQQSKNVIIECLIIDDCSPDNSMIIIREMLSNYVGNIKFVLLSHNKNRGLSEARNTGIRAASGEYVMFVDSDDYITDDAIEKLWNARLRHSGAEIVIANYFSVKDQKAFDNGVNRDTFVDGTQLRRMLMNYKVTCNAPWRLIPRSLILSNNLFFTSGLLYEDILWCHRLFALIHSAVILPDVVYFYEDNPNSITNTTREKAERSVKSYVYNCSEMLNTPYNDVYVDHQLYVLTFIMRALDVRRDYGVMGEASRSLDAVRRKLFCSTLKKGRILLAVYFLITYKPLYQLFSFKWIRNHYNNMVSIIKRTTKITELIFH